MVFAYTPLLIAASCTFVTTMLPACFTDSAKSPCNQPRSGSFLLSEPLPFGTPDNNRRAKLVIFSELTKFSTSFLVFSRYAESKMEPKSLFQFHFSGKIRGK